MSQYCMRMAAVFPSERAADAFAGEVEKLTGTYTRRDGLTVVVIFGTHREGTELCARAKERRGRVELEVVAEEF